MRRPVAGHDKAVFAEIGPEARFPAIHAAGLAVDSEAVLSNIRPLRLGVTVGPQW
jgi:hypothetical protein